MTKQKFITFGEIMLRLSPEGFNRFLQADSFDAVYGGSEANVAVSLSRFGVETEFITKLPDNDLGISARNSLRRYGVDTQNIIFSPGRLGIYFLETGASQRNSNVIYDRADSAFALSEEADYDFEKLFSGASWFHFSGITPALSENLSSICMKAVKTAKKLGLTVSCDINYRAKLWSEEKAAKTLAPMLEYTDVCFSNESAAALFGITPSEINIADGEPTNEGYTEIASEMAKRFGFTHIALTLRRSVSVSENLFAGMIYCGGVSEFSRWYDIQIVDRVGGGDAYDAGIIYGLLNNLPLHDVSEFGAAAGCLKHSINGDVNLVSVDEVIALMKTDGIFRIKR